MALASRSFPMRPRVSAFLGRWTVTKSERGHQLVQAHQLHAHVLGPVGRDERVVGHQPHAEGQGPLGHQGPDPAQTDHAEGLAVQLDALPFGALPLPRHQGGVGLGDVPGLGQQQGHGLLGGREDVRLGGVDHHDPALGGRRHVHVVQADAGPAHHDQVGPGRQHLGGHRGGRADDQGLGPDDGRHQLLGGQPELHVDLVAGLGHQVEAGLRQLLGDEHPTHGVPSCGRCMSSRRGRPCAPSRGVAEQLGQAGDALDQVVVAQGVGHPEVAREPRRPHQAPPPPWPRRWPPRPARRSSGRPGPRCPRPNRPSTEGKA